MPRTFRDLSGGVSSALDTDGRFPTGYTSTASSIDRALHYDQYRRGATPDAKADDMRLNEFSGWHALSVADIPRDASFVGPYELEEGGKPVSLEGGLVNPPLAITPACSKSPRTRPLGGAYGYDLLQVSSVAPTTIFSKPRISEHNETGASEREEREEWGAFPANASVGSGMGAMGSSVVMLPPPRPKIQPDDPLSAPNLPVEPTAVESDLPQIVAPPVVALQDKLPAFAEPSFSATQAPIVLSSGATIQPLTRLRNEHDFDWILFKTDQGFWWSPAEFFVTVAPALPPEQASVPYEIGHEPVDRDTPLPPNYVPPDLVPIPAKFCLGMKEIRLRREVVEALVRMLEAAESQGLHIRAFSGFRDFETQRRLYLEAVEKQGPKQNGTAAPGYSEHQLGTTVDVSNLDPQYVLSSRFGETPEGRWLFQHAAGIRLCAFLHETRNTQEVGYKPEPWHLRYLGHKLLRARPLWHVVRSRRGRIAISDCTPVTDSTQQVSCSSFLRFGSADGLARHEISQINRPSRNHTPRETPHNSLKTPISPTIPTLEEWLCEDMREDTLSAALVLKGACIEVIPRIMTCPFLLPLIGRPKVGVCGPHMTSTPIHVWLTFAKAEKKNNTPPYCHKQLPFTRLFPVIDVVFGYVRPPVSTASCFFSCSKA